MKALIALCSALLLAVLVGCMPVLPESSAADPAPGGEQVDATLVAAGAMTETNSGTATAPLTTTTMPTTTVAPTNTVAPTSTVVPTTTFMPTDTVPVTSTVVPTTTTVPTSTLPVPPEPSTTPGPSPTAPPATPTPLPPTSAPTVPPTPTIMPTATEGPPATNTPLPGTVFARNDNTYTDGNSLFVVGEVVNGGPAPVYNVQVIATFYSADGQIVGANSGMALLPRTQPTQANPFKLQLSPPPANATRYELSLTWGDLTIATFDRATITREELNQDNGIEIVGDIRNDHRSELRNIQAVVTFYDASGLVVDAVVGSVGTSSLAPGDSTNFTIQPARSFTFDHYLVQVEGMLLP